MRVIANIGLNNNPKTHAGLIEYFNTYGRSVEVVGSKLQLGTYNGEKEPTSIITLEISHTLQSKIVSLFEDWASHLEQDCIAISTDTFDMVVYADGFKGERNIKFDEQYFLR